jgi:hypothetical protein
MALRDATASATGASSSAEHASAPATTSATAAATTATASAAGAATAATAQPDKRTSPLTVYVAKHTPLDAYCQEFLNFAQQPDLFSITNWHSNAQTLMSCDIAQQVLDCAPARPSNGTVSALQQKANGIQTCAADMVALPERDKAALEAAKFRAYPLAVAATAYDFVFLVEKKMKLFKKKRCASDLSFRVVHQHTGDYKEYAGPTYVQLAAALSGSLSYAMLDWDGIDMCQLPALVPVGSAAWKVIWCAATSKLRASPFGPRGGGECIEIADVAAGGLPCKVDAGYMVGLAYMRFAVLGFCDHVSTRLEWTKHCGPPSATVPA